MSKLVKFILFADDMNMFCSANDAEQLENIVCCELGKLQLWFSINKLSLNIAKTNSMLFSGRMRVPDINITIKYTQITRVRVTKFLGVLIDESFNWKDHIISQVRSKLSISVGMYMLYSTLVLPYLLYCVKIWGNTFHKFTLYNYVVKGVIQLMHNAQRCDHTTM